MTGYFWYNILSWPFRLIANICEGIISVLWSLYRLGHGPSAYRQNVPFNPIRAFIDGFKNGN